MLSAQSFWLAEKLFWPKLHSDLRQQERILGAGSGWVGWLGGCCYSKARPSWWP